MGNKSENRMHKLPIMKAHDISRNAVGIPPWVRQWRLPIVVPLALSILPLTACEVPADTRFSATAADLLLNELANMHMHEASMDDVVPCANLDNVSGVSKYIARYLVTRLDFSCSTVKWKSQVRRHNELWLTEQEVVVAWNSGSDLDDVLAISVFFDDNPRDSLESRLAVAHLAGLLEGLRTFLTADAPSGVRVVLTLSPTFGSPATSYLSPSLPHITPYAEYSTVVSGGENPMPSVSAVASNDPGWVIGIVPYRGMVASRIEAESDEADSVLIAPVPVGRTNPVSRFYAEYRPRSPERRVAAPDQDGQHLLRTLQAMDLGKPNYSYLPRYSVQVFADIAKRTYWSAGVLLPLIFLVIVVRVVMIESSSMVAHLQRRISALDRKRSALSDRIEKLRDRLSTDTSPGMGAEETSVPSRGSIAPLSQAFDRWRKNRWRRQLKRKREQFTSVDDRLTEYCTEWPHWSNRRSSAARRLRELGSGALEVVLAEGGSRRGVGAVALGAIAVVTSFTILHYDPVGLGGANSASLWSRPIVTVVAVFGVLGMFAIGKMRVFSLGAAVICLIGLDTIELSPFAEFGARASLNELYDSQTVTLMFTCLVLLVGIQEAIVHSRKTDTKKENWLPSASVRNVDALRNVQMTAKRQERRWCAGLGIVYLMLVYHTIFPALEELMIGGPERPGLLAVTVVTTATLLMPLFPLATLLLSYGTGRLARSGLEGDTEEIVEKVEARMAATLGGEDANSE